MHASEKYIRDHSEELRAEAVKSDESGRLTDRTVEIMRASGGIRLLQAQDLGGFEEHPNVFMNWAMAVGEYHPSAGWVAGVVGVHPWEISVMDPRLQQEVYGEDPDTWTASPYAPFGRAVPVPGGFRLTGRWPYSTGTDHSDWVILGGMVVGEDGQPGTPPDIRHFVLPRSDYQILEGTWNVMGLGGTGSKDVTMTDTFVPDYRVVSDTEMKDGVYSDRWRRGASLYQMRFSIMFPYAIAAGTFGIARGFVKAMAAHIEGRTSVQGAIARTDPFQIAALARAEADIDASICHVQSLIDGFWQQVNRGEEITIKQRLAFRRDQVRATDRAIEAANELFRLAGSSSIAQGRGLEAYFRDLQVGATHICNARETAYLAWGMDRFGGEIPPGSLY